MDPEAVARTARSILTPAWVGQQEGLQILFMQVLAMTSFLAMVLLVKPQTNSLSGVVLAAMAAAAAARQGLIHLPVLMAWAAPVVWALVMPLMRHLAWYPVLPWVDQPLWERPWWAVQAQALWMDILARAQVYQSTVISLRATIM
jgi:hypothetical protein